MVRDTRYSIISKIKSGVEGHTIPYSGYARRCGMWSACCRMLEVSRFLGKESDRRYAYAFCGSSLPLLPYLLLAHDQYLSMAVSGPFG